MGVKDFTLFVTVINRLCLQLGFLSIAVVRWSSTRAVSDQFLNISRPLFGKLMQCKDLVQLLCFLLSPVHLCLSLGSNIDRQAMQFLLVLDCSASVSKKRDSKTMQFVSINRPKKCMWQYIADNNCVLGGNTRAQTFEFHQFRTKIVLRIDNKENQCFDKPRRYKKSKTTTRIDPKVRTDAHCDNVHMQVHYLKKYQKQTRRK